MSAPEETETFRALRTRHKVQTRLVREQGRQLREAAERERRMRAELASLDEPAVRAYVQILRRRDDLGLSEALSLVAEVFTDE